MAQPQSVEGMGWLHKCDRTDTGLAEPWLQQLQLTRTGLLDQQVDQRPYGPSAARQLRRQRGIPRFQKPPTPARELGRSPQGRVNLLSGNGSGGHEEAKNLYIYTVSYTQSCGSELALLIGG